MIRGAALACVGAMACHTDPPVRSCDDALAGLWQSPRGPYQLLDRGQRLELHPSFRDLPADLPPGVVSAPSVVDLTRVGPGRLVRGTLTRRYERGTQFCAIERPATLLRCDAAGLALELVEPAPPTDWDACLAPTPLPVTLTLTR